MTMNGSFFIVTPSLNQVSYLKRCVASVADQAGKVTAEVFVADGGSRDGTTGWLRQADPVPRGGRGQHGARLSWASEPDGGMYEALNKGVDRLLAAGGRSAVEAHPAADVVGFLNADEQYLPGSLAAVAEAFCRWPEADIVHGDYLVLRPGGSLACWRKSYRLRWPYVVCSHLYALSCAVFYRRRVFESGLRFDERYRSLGDADFVVRALRSGFRARHLPRFLATFTLRGDNLSTSALSRDEEQVLLRSAPRAMRWLRGPINLLRCAEMLASGATRSPCPFAYEVHVEGGGGSRRVFHAKSGSWRWPRGGTEQHDPVRTS